MLESCLLVRDSCIGREIMEETSPKMNDLPLEARGSIFDESRENGILVGYVRDEEGRRPVVDLIHKKSDGKIVRIRHNLSVVMTLLEKFRHA